MHALKAFEKRNLCLPLAKSLAGEMTCSVYRTTISSSYICRARNSDFLDKRDYVVISRFA